MARAYARRSIQRCARIRSPTTRGVAQAVSGSAPQSAQVRRSTGAQSQDAAYSVCDRTTSIDACSAVTDLPTCACTPLRYSVSHSFACFVFPLPRACAALRKSASRPSATLELVTKRRVKFPRLPKVTVTVKLVDALALLPALSVAVAE